MFNNNAHSYFAKKMMSDALSQLAAADKIDTGIPYIHAKTIEFLIKRKKCICGADIEFGNEAYKELNDLLEFIPPQSIGTSIGQFVRECELRCKSSDTLFEDISTKFGFIREFDNTYTGYQNQINIIREKLEKMKNVGELQARLSTYERALRNLSIDVIGLEEKIVRGRAKINEYIRHRPSNNIIAAFTEECKCFWKAILDHCSEIKNPNVKVGEYRNSDGGCIFFRPIALYPFARAAVRIKENYQTSYSEIIHSIPNDLLWIQNRLWKKIIWDDVAKKMVMGNATLIELILLYIAAPELLSDKENKKIIDNLKSIWDEADGTIVQERLDSIIRGDMYI